jgi:ABC-2 type transport system ATP-binding protein
VLRGVDFDVARGSIFALLGSNGAGKTTVVKILSTLLKPDSGTATVDGFESPRNRRTCGSPSASPGPAAEVDGGVRLGTTTDDAKRRADLERGSNPAPV